MSTKLLNCPFCAGMGAIVIDQGDYGYRPLRAKAQCLKCRVSTEWFTEEVKWDRGQWRPANDPKALAADAWNQRC